MRKITAFCAQAIPKPRTHSRSALLSVSGMKKIVSVGVFRKIRHHRTDDRKVIYVLSHVRKQIADGDSTFAVLLKLPRTCQSVSDVVELSRFNFRWKRFSVFLIQSWFRVERINLRNTAVHVQKYDASSFRIEVRLLRSQRINVCVGSY